MSEHDRKEVNEADLGWYAERDQPITDAIKRDLAAMQAAMQDMGGDVRVTAEPSPAPATPPTCLCRADRRGNEHDNPKCPLAHDFHIGVCRKCGRTTSDVSTPTDCSTQPAQPASLTDPLTGTDNLRPNPYELTPKPASLSEEEITAKRIRDVTAAHEWLLEKHPNEVSGDIRPWLMQLLAEYAVEAVQGQEERIVELDKEIGRLRFRLYYNEGNISRTSHTTSCSIWREDGQGHSEGFEGDSGPCNCGALINFYRKQYEAAESRAEQLQADNATLREGIEEVKRTLRTWDVPYPPVNRRDVAALLSRLDSTKEEQK